MPGHKLQHAADPDLHFQVRSQRADGEQSSVTTVLQNASWTASKTAIVVSDLWDQHWCRSANSRVRQLAPDIENFLARARRQGMLIVHSPSGTLDYYSEHPARHLAQSALGGRSSSPTRHIWLDRNPENEPPLPIDDSDGGCPCAPACEPLKLFTRQSDVISIDPVDVISTDQHEIGAIFKRHPIAHVMILGFHLNMCILGRSFGIRHWVELGREVLLVRDLTDVIYNPESHPFVTIDQARNLVTTHIETYLCPSVLSSDVVSAMSSR